MAKSYEYSLLHFDLKTGDLDFINHYGNEGWMVAGFQGSTALLCREKKKADEITAVAAERERCAMIADTYYELHGKANWEATAEGIARLIRGESC